jgi:hypothetical protein
VVVAELVWQSRLVEEREQQVLLFRLVQGPNLSSLHPPLYLPPAAMEPEQMRKPLSSRFLTVLELRPKDLTAQLVEKPFQPPLVEQAVVDHVRRPMVDLHRHLQLVLLIANSVQIPSSPPHSSLFLAPLV